MAFLCSKEATGLSCFQMVEPQTENDQNHRHIIVRIESPPDTVFSLILNYDEAEDLVQRLQQTLLES